MEPLGFRDQSDVLNQTPGALDNFKLLKGAMTRSLSAEQVVDNIAGLETSSRLKSTVPGLGLSPEVLAGVIVAAALVSLGICVIAIWIHVRRKRSKSGQLEVNAQPQPPQPQISIISDKSPTIIGVGPGSYYYNGKTEGNDETGTEYGSMEGSYPPSPTLSFRSAIDGAGFSRSRTGTGTSFGTVASFNSHRSRLSTTASFQTCFEEEFS